MPARSIKEEVIGELPLAHSVEMFELEDGSFEVVGRLMPDSDEEAGTYEPHKILPEKFATRSAADFRFHQLASLMRKVGPPA